eukprot:TRINITY_DN5775_c0_g1_i1.p1 TRINITY_DN5775_c0_g1~~TRINITY_DN5775_c0_g1_i1.p1  ORF type:complete len:445 (-),score=83.45 TRINITY_DN5775_c0_g1_i1:12-1346(-)
MVVFRRLLTHTNHQHKYAQRLHSFGPSVFSEFSPLAAKYKSVNLGQGFPNFNAPSFIKEAAKRAIDQDLVQYTRSQGHPRLVNAIASFYGTEGNHSLPKHSGLKRKIDPLNEIVVTAGATEALFASMMAFIEKEDEVILIEPFYDSYPADVIMAEGRCRYVPLRLEGNEFSAKNWKLDTDELEALITPKTKMLVLNNPQNIPGKVCTKDELQKIADIAIKHDLIVISDEVYEWLVYDDATHISIATLPGMKDRTITVGSAGKTFSVTGYKIGWTIAAPHLSSAIQLAHQWIPFSVATPLQDAVAQVLEDQSTISQYLPELQLFYTQKRDLLLDILTNAGLRPIVPQGGYFILADVSKVNKKHYIDFQSQDGEISTPLTQDYQFCRWLTKEIGVTAIPVSPFYSEEHSQQRLPQDYVRFCFCKTDETLHLAGDNLKRLGKYVNSS